MQVVCAHRPEKIAALFCTFSKISFPVGVLFQRRQCSNIINLRKIRLNEMILIVFEVRTYAWDSELSILLHHLLSSKIFFLLIYMTALGKGNRFVEVLLFCEIINSLKNCEIVNEIRRSHWNKFLENSHYWNLKG